MGEYFHGRGRDRSNVEAIDEDETTLDETLVDALWWSDLAPTGRLGRAPLDSDSTADEGSPVLFPSEPRLSSEPPAPAIAAQDGPEGALDETSIWSAPHRASSMNAIGKIVAGRYLLGEVLGAGGMGTVFVAEHTDLGKRVAIKVLAATLDGHTDATARFLREAKAASTIESEHIAQVFDVGEDLHLGLYMVMELLKGEDLSHVLAARGTLRAAVAAGIVSQVCLALERAHAAGVVHRDLKPANVFLTRGDDGSVKVKVLDFGIAKLVEDARSRTLGITQSGIVIGTPHYMSPEQAQGLETVDHRTDLYSLGALLFEAVAGTPPYPDLETHEETLYKVLSEDPPRLASKVPGVVPALDDLVAEMMSRDPARRPSTAREVRNRLATIFPSLGRRRLALGGSAPSASTPVVVPPRTGGGVTVDSTRNATVPPSRRSKPALLAAAAALVLTTIVVAFFVVRPSSSSRAAANGAPGLTVQAAVVEVPESVTAAPPATGVARLFAAEDEAATRVQQAQRALERGDAENARRLATEATLHAPASTEAWFTLGAALEMLGDVTAARAAYETCKVQVQGDRARECAALLER